MKLNYLLNLTIGFIYHIKSISFLKNLLIHYYSIDFYKIFNFSWKYIRNYFEFLISKNLLLLTWREQAKCDCKINVVALDQIMVRLFFKYRSGIVLNLYCIWFYFQFSLNYFPESLTELRLNGSHIYRTSRNWKTVFLDMHEKLPNLEVIS